MHAIWVSSHLSNDESNIEPPISNPKPTLTTKHNHDEPDADDNVKGFLKKKIQPCLFTISDEPPPHAFTPLFTYVPAITSDSHPHPRPHHQQQNQLICLAYPNRPYTWEKNGQAQSAPATSSVEGGNGTGTGTDSLFSVSVMNSMFFFVFSSSSFVPLFLSFRQSSIQLFYCPFHSQQFIFVCIHIFIKRLYPYNRRS